MCEKSMVNEVVSKYKTNNPYELIEILNINLFFKPLGKVNGFLLKNKRNYFIYINSSLSQLERRFTLCHELGHFFMHKNFNTIFLNRGFNLTNKLENEANRFAIFLTLKNYQDIKDYDFTYFQIAKITGIPEKHLKLIL